MLEITPKKIAKIRDLQYLLATSQEENALLRAEVLRYEQKEKDLRHKEDLLLEKENVLNALTFDLRHRIGGLKV